MPILRRAAPPSTILTGAMIEIVDPGRSEPTLDQTRILLVIGHLGLGGAERQVLVLARELIQRHGARIEVWGFHGPGPTPQVWEEYGIPWRVVRFPWARKRVRRIRRLVQFGWKLRRARPDVILSFTLYPNVACGLTWRWSGAKAYLWGQRDALERIHATRTWIASRPAGPGRSHPTPSTPANSWTGTSASRASGSW